MYLNQQPLRSEHMAFRPVPVCGRSFFYKKSPQIVELSPPMCWTNFLPRYLAYIMQIQLIFWNYAYLSIQSFALPATVWSQFEGGILKAPNLGELAELDETEGVGTCAN